MSGAVGGDLAEEMEISGKFGNFYICNKVFYICNFHTSLVNPLLFTAARGWPRPECHVALRTRRVALRTFQRGSSETNRCINRQIRHCLRPYWCRVRSVIVRSTKAKCPECHPPRPECHVALRTRPTAGSREQKGVDQRGVKITNVKNLVTNVKTYETAQNFDLLREITVCARGSCPI